MNENAQKWVKALESGRFEQGTGALTKNDRYCCLGVACVIYQEEVGDLRVAPGDNGVVHYDGDGAILPFKVKEWLGLYNSQGGYSYDAETDLIGFTNALTSDNDAGATLAEIAATIRSEPEGLFV